ncbi:unnamed protein product [Rotaria socialis]|uniref:Major facilitator superfamily (MFS) profile domain-containing protein n=2 Tax=Rotaria socialis TaxID=392032 RepID=A0A817XT19_9BILA|nr:unnamed protein product [Rotaria socialis]
MAAQKYRLAPPDVHDNNNNNKKLYRTVDYVEVNTNRVPLINKEEIRQIHNLPSSIPRWWLVIPCLLFITLPTASDSLLMNDFIVRRYEHHYELKTLRKKERTACLQVSTSTLDYWYLEQYSPVESGYNMVQKAAAKFNVKSSSATLIPSLFAIVLLGSNCDTIGRRPLLFLPFIGKIVRYTLMIIIIARDLPDGWLIACQAVEAFFGSFGIVMLSALAFITDCTHESERTRPFLIIEVIVLVARVVPVLAIGLWLQHSLYIIPLSVCLGLSIVGMLYVLFIQPESVQTVRHLSMIQQMTRIRLKPIIRCIHVFFIKRPGSNQQHLILISIVNVLLLLMLFGYMSVLAIFAYGRPFCMDAFHVGMLITTHAISVCVLTALISLFKKHTLDNTYLYPIIGLFGLVGDLVIFGLAKRTWLLYIAASIGSLFFITMPVLRSKLSRLVEPSEYAIVFIAAAFIEAGGDKGIDAASNSIYNASLHFWPGLVFLVLALLSIFPLFIMGYLAYSEKKTVPITTPYNNTKV